MIDFAAKIAAALAVTAGLAAPVLAAPVTEIVQDETVAAEQVDLAYLCEYVIVFDVWGNAYYEYICY
jgi:hypothetical protein